MNGFWNSKTDKEILSTIKVESLTFIGKFKKFPKFSMFENIRNIDYSPVLNLKSNLDDRNFVKVQIINKTNFDLKPNAYYNITAKVIPQKTRTFHSSEFLLEFNDDSTFELYAPNEKEFTELVFKKYSEANNAHSQDILKSVKTITYQINKRNETFIYELLQNADDYPRLGEKVTVNFYVTDKYLLFTHSGSEFNFNNVYSLCAVNAEDKVDDFDKIGFKGIGFKSVFKANEFVYLKSGNYSFRFDKAFHHAEYPWQLMPIWTDYNDLEISLKNNSRFLNSNVAIALKPRNPDKILIEYSETLELFVDERILLFLRNVEKVNVFLNNGRQIFCDRNKSKWWLKQFEVEVSQDITDYLNAQISEGNEEVPSKFANLKSCKISFAALIHNGQLVLLSDAKLFNYLPLGINLNLPFLINSDFIPDGEREGLIGNKWNEFLLVESGRQFVQFIKSIVNDQKRDKKFCYSIINLIPNFNSISEILKSNEKWSSYFRFFKEGFDLSVIGSEPVKFIPTQSGNLETLSNILIDETGLADLLEDNFEELTGITQKLIHYEVGEGIEKIKLLIAEHFPKAIYNIETLKADFTKPKFQEWLKIPSNNFKIIQHFSLHTELQSLLDTEEIILSENLQLTKCISLFLSIPDEVNFIASNKINSTLKSLLDEAKVELKLKLFNAIEFYKIHSKTVNVFLTTEKNILNIWNFIYDNWKAFKEDDEINKSLPQLNILCKPITTDVLNIQTVSAVYLPKELAKEDEVESIIETLNLNKFFIESKYDSPQRSNNKLQWNEIFIVAKAKRGLSAVIAEIIPQLKDIENSLHVKACIEICKYWKANKDRTEKQLTEAQFIAIKQTLKIKCGNDYYLPSQCIIPEYYLDDKRLSEIMPSIILTNQISSDYQPNKTFVSEWKQFFVLIGCRDLNNEQLIFNSKLDYLLSNQEKFQENHFEIIKEFDLLWQANQDKEVKMEFDFANKFAKLKLKTSLENVSEFPSQIHFPTEFTPELELQSDTEIQSQFKFLSPLYFSNSISKSFLTAIGVNNNFAFKNLTPTTFSFYPTQLISNKKHLPKIWKFITESETNLKQFATSNILVIVKTSETVQVSETVFKKPTELYSENLSNYIEDKTLISMRDFSKQFVDDKKTVTLEQQIGINQELNINQCFSLLKAPKGLKQEVVSSLKLVSIIQRNQINPDMIQGINLPNVNYEWLPSAELYISSDAGIKTTHPNNLLHTDFNPISQKFFVKTISDSDYKFHHESDISDDDVIKKQFCDRAEYLAFALKKDLNEYLSIASQIIDSINSLKFVKCKELYFSITHSSLNWKRDVPIHSSNETIYYIDDLSERKSELRLLLIKHLSKYGSISEKQFKRILIEDDEKDIIDSFDKDFEIPEGWKRKKSRYIEEVEDFILNELENTEWSEYIIELKNILELSLNHPKEKQKLYNLIAKLKLAKHINIHFEVADKDYNHLQNGNEKYFVHSARGAFAYIHPKEILKMKNDGYKMALDFSTKSRIKVYDTAEEILQLNTSHILAYQGEKPIEDLISFCEANKDANKHLLIIDRDNSGEKSKALLKLLNLEDDYQ